MLIKCSKNQSIQIDIGHLAPPDSDTDTSQELAIKSWVVLLADSPLGLKPKEVIVSFMERLVLSLDEVIQRYSELDDKLVNSVHVSESGTTLEYIKEFEKTPIYREYLYFYKNMDFDVFKYVHTFLVFLKKQEMSRPELAPKALRQWFAVEERLANLRLPKCVDDLKTIISYSLPDIGSEPLIPKFSGGKVAERGVGTIAQKIEHLARSQDIHDVLHDPFYGILWKGEGVARHVTDMLHQSGYYRRTSKELGRQKDVAKSFKAVRLMCMEPNQTMYIQQAILPAYVAAIDRSPIGKFINLKDQTENQFLSRLGSMYQHVSTIDLSSASDSVSWELVRYAFPEKLTYYLEKTRTRRVRTLDKSIVELKKFAPMGSAMCFPTQCVIFTSICILAAHIYSSGRVLQDALENGCGMTEADVANSIHSFAKLGSRWIPTNWSEQPAGKQGMFSFNAMRVYGDDIIIDTRLTDIVVSLLTAFGFECNISKSFSGSVAFRESCGVHALLGEDVTPLTLKVKGCLPGKQRLPSLLASLCDFANRCYEYGYRYLRLLMLRWLRAMFGKGIFYTRDRNIGCSIHVGSDIADDVYFAKAAEAMKLRWSRDLQCYVAMRKYAKVYDPKPYLPGGYDDPHELYQYHVKLRSASLQSFYADAITGEESVPITIAIHTTTCVIGSAWTPIR